MVRRLVYAGIAMFCLRGWYEQTVLGIPKPLVPKRLM